MIVICKKMLKVSHYTVVNNNLINKKILEVNADGIYNGSPVGVKEFYFLVLILTMRHNLSYEAIEDVLRLLKVLLPSPSNIPR